MNKDKSRGEIIYNGDGRESFDVLSQANNKIPFQNDSFEEIQLVNHSLRTVGKKTTDARSLACWLGLYLLHLLIFAVVRAILNEDRKSQRKY